MLMPMKKERLPDVKKFCIKTAKLQKSINTKK